MFSIVGILCCNDPEMSFSSFLLLLSEPCTLFSVCSGPCPRPAPQHSMFFSLFCVLFAVSARANHAHARRSLAIIRRQGALGNLGNHLDAALFRASWFFFLVHS